MRPDDKNRITPVADDAQHAARLVVAAAWQDERTKALYVHRDLVQTQEPWAEEAHIEPMKVSEQFGDVESFVAYVKRYGVGNAGVLVTWNSQGIRALLDYAEAADKPGRCAWTAHYPFRRSLQWQAWAALASGKGINQRTAVETLEDLALDIVEPSATDLTALLRSLRAMVNAKAEAELRPDGTSSVAFVQEKTLKTGGNLDLPAHFVIAIPVLKGHLDDEGRPVLYRLHVRLRATVGDDGHLTLRFSVPNAERVLEDAFADRVALARELLGESFPLLRAAD